MLFRAPLPRTTVALAALACLAAQAQVSPEPTPTAENGKPPKAATSQSLERVEVKGSASDNDLRRASTASKIIVSKEDIERFGDGSVSEVLKRLPGVTSGGRPGRGGDVRMRGMGGGYTQLLVNSERMPPGFSLDDLQPDQVERIEIMRAPTAEYGARAVAGTINIVLKEALKRRLNEFRLGTQWEEGRSSPNLSWTRNDKAGEAVAYTFTLSAHHNSTRDENQSRTRYTSLADGTTALEQQEVGYSSGERDAVHLNGRIQATLGRGESLVFMPFFMSAQGSTHGQAQLDQQPGSSVPQPYARSIADGDGRFNSSRVNLQWLKPLGEGMRLEVRGGAGVGNFESHGLRSEFDSAGLLTRTLDDTTNTRENSWTLNSKVSQQMESEHSLVGGLELERNVRRQNRTTLQNGLPILTEFGDDLNASTLRMAAYAQDEWSPTKQISAYAGLRWEGIRTESDSEAYAVSNLSSVVTPLLHATWRPDEKSRDQLRASLTRSYKAASLQDLIARPAISQRYPTGSNEASSPDRAGNPNLAPELARGFEIAWEHYLEKGGLLSINYFLRHISDLQRNVVSLETVSWSATPRWVSRPQNVGNATAQGVELEAKFRLDEFWADALPVSIRTNVSFFDSVVDQVPGPNNRLEGQPKGTANVGIDYKLRTLPFSFGASVNYTPAYDLQISDIQKNYVGSKTVADAFVVWFINPSAQLRLSASNFRPIDYLSTSSILSNGQLQDTEGHNFSKVRWGVRLELKL